MPVALPDGAQVLPLRLGQRVVAALNRVADVDHEIRMHELDLAPDASEDFRLGAAGAVADDGKAEVVLGFGEGAQADYGGEKQRYQAAGHPAFIAGMHIAIVADENFTRSQH